jgi:CheY-like chemotaxis protein
VRPFKYLGFATQLVTLVETFIYKMAAIPLWVGYPDALQTHVITLNFAKELIMHSVSSSTTAFAMKRIEAEDVPINPATASSVAPDRRPSTVLIVEDNDVVCDFLQSALRAYGYNARSVDIADQAVDYCRRERNTVHALIADVSLCGFACFETAQMLLRICPSMKVVFTSGYPYEYLVRIGLLPPHLGTCMFLQKPFLPSELMALLRPSPRA